MNIQLITRTFTTALVATGLLIAGTTYAQADTTPPEISDISTASTTETSTHVLWETDEPATSMVEYGVNTFYGATTTLIGTTTEMHNRQLLGLLPGTIYHFRVHSEDAADNLAISSDQMFTTLGTSTASSTDTVAPIISDVDADPATTTATITWMTNEAGDSWVKYGTTTGYGASTTLDTAFVNSHSVLLSGLTASTTYHFQVISKDDDGNTASSTDQTFMTLGLGTPTSTPTTTPPVVDNEAIQELIDALEGFKGFLANMINFLDDKIDQLLGAIGEDGNGNGNGGEHEDATITPSNTQVREGTNVDFTGHDFGIEEGVTVTRGGTVVRTAHADNAGNFSTGSIATEGDAGESETYTFKGMESNITATSTIQIIP